MVWGLASAADGQGAELHPNTEVTAITRSNGRATGVKVDGGRAIRAGQVVSATAGWSSSVAAMAGVPLPITTHILQAFVTEPLKPLLDVVVVSSQMHLYISQTERGEFVIGAEIEPWTTYRQQGTMNFLQEASRHTLELFPFLANVRLLRQWAGITDMTPDYSPIMSASPVKNYWLDAGWGTWGFKATPVSGKYMAEMVANEKAPEILHPFRLERFKTFDLANEMGATAASH